MILIAFWSRLGGSGTVSVTYSYVLFICKLKIKLRIRGDQGQIVCTFYKKIPSLIFSAHCQVFSSPHEFPMSMVFRHHFIIYLLQRSSACCTNLGTLLLFKYAQKQ